MFGYKPSRKYAEAFAHGSLAGRQYALASVEALLVAEIKKLKRSGQDAKKVEMLVSEIHYLVGKVKEMYDI